MKHHFQIQTKEFKGPLDIPLTIYSGQTSQPPWRVNNDYYEELVLIEDKPCLVKIRHENKDPDGFVEIIAKSPSKILKKCIKAQVKEIFGLNDDLNQIYNFLSEDPKLAPTIEFCRGLRLFKAHNPFECVISSISSSNCSILRWTRSIHDIKEKWGQKYQFGSRDFYTFPSPEILGNVPEHDLEEMQRLEDELSKNFVFEKNLKACGVGYRAKYIIQAANMVQEEIKLKKLARMNYEKAFDTMLKIPGVGPKVADCILLYGFGMGQAFPTDVWIKRIVEHLYFPGEELKPQKVREIGIELFGDYAGYVQLYLFHYARKSGLMDNLKTKKV